MLQLEDVSYSYPGREKALADANATLAGGITVLVGPNAGGKTTLLRLLAGLLEPQKGVIREVASGKVLTTGALRVFSRMVMQDADPQILGATVSEDVTLGRAASTLGSEFDARAAVLRDKFGLGEFWNEPVDALSYGQKRKLCLMHALLAGPRMLLLDEPFAGLDYPAGRELRGFIAENRTAGLTQVISTHELEPVYDLADHVVVVSGGAVAAEGEPGMLAEELAKWSVRAPGKGWD